jgi:membrane-anchored protein YejM (alkaline phosphatase superfamily)
VIIYTSDHGESFYVDGKAGHGGVTREEATVPLFLLGDAGRNIDTDFKASHCNVFTALLDLMNYPEELRKYPYSISLFKAKKQTPRLDFIIHTEKNRIRLNFYTQIILPAENACIFPVNTYRKDAGIFKYGTAQKYLNKNFELW